MQKLFLILITSTILTTSCGNKPNNVDAKTGTYQAAADDTEMNAAMSEAKKNLHKFFTAFISTDTTQHGFAVKLPFAIPGAKGNDAGEYIWIGDLDYLSDSLFGTVGNEPEWTKEVKAGEVIYINTAKIADWYFTQNHKLIGGYTIHVVYKHLNSAEKQQMENELGCKIE
jgi:uncharacterized protein YegJ (DUF2314 family)